jgi:transposase InsO family protein
VIPHLFKEAFHGRDRNEALHFDFISMHQLTPKSKHLYKYVLILKDDFSGFVELILRTSPDHFTVADSLMDCYKRFGVPKTLVSDQGSHFVDKILKEFNRILQARHHFVTAYIPWGNGQVEICAVSYNLL